MHGNTHFTGNEHWLNAVDVPAASYDCGYCSKGASSGTGLRSDGGNVFLRICPNCNGPTFFDIHKGQWPGSRMGLPVSSLPKDVEAIYEEARTSAANGAVTGAVMLCRKILMHVAVEKGAKGGLSFEKYVEWLINERHAPRGAEEWLHYVRSRANEANHEIIVMKEEDARGVLRFTEALLRGVYELPGLVPIKPPAESAEETPETEDQ